MTELERSQVPKASIECICFKIIVLNFSVSFFVLENDSLTKRQKNLSATLLYEEVGEFASMNRINISCVFATLIFKLYT